MTSHILRNNLFTRYRIHRKRNISKIEIHDDYCFSKVYQIERQKRHSRDKYIYWFFLWALREEVRIAVYVNMKDSQEPLKVERSEWGCYVIVRVSDKKRCLWSYVEEITLENRLQGVKDHKGLLNALWSQLRRAVYEDTQGI